MVAQRKGAAKQKGAKGQQGKNTPVKMFEEKFDEEMDAEIDSESDSSEEPQPKKTPNKATPGPKSAKKDMHVSFQLQGKTPNSGQKQVQKGRTPTPMVPKHQQNQSLREQTLKKGLVGSPNLKGFAGVKGNSPGVKAQGKRKATEEDDEDDFEDDDDEDDDIDLEDDEDDDDDAAGGLKMVGDDDDDDDEDDDDDDDDEDLDSEEEKEMLKKTKAVKKNQPKDQKQQQQQKTPSKQSPATDRVKQQGPDAQARPPSQGLMQRASLDKKTLFVRGLPADVIEAELKAISSDIVSARLPQKQFKIRGKPRFAFIEFENEEKTEENFKLLSGKKVRDCQIDVDFCGVKSKNKSFAKQAQADLSRQISSKKLFVSGLTSETNIADVAPLFPKAHSIIMSNRDDPKSFAVVFLEEDDAAKALKKNEKAVINGRTITLMYAFEGKKYNGPQKNLGGQRQEGQKFQKFGPPSKKARREPASSDEE